MAKPITFNDDEISNLVRTIAEPTFNYIMRRIRKEIYNHERYSKISLDQYLMVLCATMGSVDANMLRFMQNFAKLQNAQDVDLEILRGVFIKCLYSQLDIVLQ
jgi:hypothetical protein